MTAGERWSDRYAGAGGDTAGGIPHARDRMQQEAIEVIPTAWNQIITN
jgi:hypothetical protein